MARTTIEKVSAILSSAPADSVVEEFIDSANLLVTEVLGSDTTLSAALKADIERWLAAHMIAVTLKRMPAKAGAAGASIEFLGKTGLGLSSTPYGQQVMVLDTTGSFRNLSDSKPARLVAITSFKD